MSDINKHSILMWMLRRIQTTIGFLTLVSISVTPVQLITGPDLRGGVISRWSYFFECIVILSVFAIRHRCISNSWVTGLLTLIALSRIPSLYAEPNLICEYGIRVTPDGLACVSAISAIVFQLSVSLAAPCQHSTDYRIHRWLTCFALVTTPLFTIPFVLALRPRLPPPVFVTSERFRDSTALIRLSETVDYGWVVYTVDGADPSTGKGRLYDGPVPLQFSTVVRAASFRIGYKPSLPQSHTYVFPGQLGYQAERISPVQYPQKWGDVPAKYEVDRRVHLGSLANLSTENDALRTIPSVFLSLDPVLLFGSRGIYVNSMMKGDDWEVPCGLELYDPDTGHEQSLNCGLRMHGGMSRSLKNTRKLSFRLYFREKYGGKLRAPIFSSAGASEFEQLVLRGGSIDTWAMEEHAEHAQFIRDEYVRRLQSELGQSALRGRFVHLFLNGLYWGIYNLVERPDEDFVESTFSSGKNKKWDIIKDGEILDGSWQSWDELDEACIRLKLDPDSVNDWLEVTRRMDVDNYIDFLLVNLFCGNREWCAKNYIAFCGNTRDAKPIPYRFLVWDADWSLRVDHHWDENQIDNAELGVALPFHRMRHCTSFRLLFADRVQKHFVEKNGFFFEPPVMKDETIQMGAMSKPMQLYVRLLGTIDAAIVLESARWGDECRPIPFGASEWNTESQLLLREFFLGRSLYMIQLFRDHGLYIDAPRSSRDSGKVTSGELVVLESDHGHVYFTVDDTDPRTLTGAISSSAIRYTDPYRIVASVNLRARSFDGESWSAITTRAYITTVP